MRRIRARKKRNIMLLVALLLMISVGYAYLSQLLTINGTSTIDNVKWDIHFENYQTTSSSSVTPSVVPDTSENNKTTISYEIDFDTPGQVYEFTVDTVNAGTIDAMIKNYTSTIKIGDGSVQDAAVVSNIPSYLNYSVTYADGKAIQNNHLLAKNSSETIKVRVEFKKVLTAEEIAAAANKTITLTITINYGQTDGSEVPVRVDFATSSWDDIIDSYNDGDIARLEENMENGTTRAVPLDLDLDGESDATCNLRIANLSKPAECENEGFSQTACGLVVECANVVARRVMNSTDTNVGGWKDSEMRAYLNNTTAGAQSIYNALPDELSSKIISTTVVSGHGSTEGETNFTTTDKIYLLSPVEIWGNNTFTVPDSARNLSRQLDYYSSKGIDDTNYSDAIKRDITSSPTWWWLRAASSSHTDSFRVVLDDGQSGRTDANIEAEFVPGISPVFRIGTTS